LKFPRPACLLIVALAAAGAAAAGKTTAASSNQAGSAGPASRPLLALAREREIERAMEGALAPATSGLREAEHQRDQARVPRDEDCAASLGATRFSELHSSVAVARQAEGDFAGAANEYRRAIACRPRDAELHGALAGVLFDARDYAGTRQALATALALDSRSVGVNRLAGNLDFVEERWADAISRFRYVASSDADRDQAGYGQLMYWLAQRRGGIAKPEFVARTPGEGWPQPLLLYMRGEYTEAELVVPIQDGDLESNRQPNTSADERLCEALFYVGEDYWARGDRETARNYFAALVNIKVIYFLEHGIALAEIAKLRE
jgi:lipoprotein NlpI